MTKPLKPEQKKARGSNVYTQATDKGQTSKSSKSIVMSGASTAHDDQQHDDRAGHDPTEKPTKSGKSKSVNPINDEPNKKLESYSCRFCGKNFEKYQALGGHINKLHYKDLDKEKVQKAHELLNTQKKQQLSTWHNSHLNFGGGLATGIAPDPYAPSGISRPVLATDNRQVSWKHRSKRTYSPAVNQVPASVESQEPTSITEFNSIPEYPVASGDQISRHARRGIPIILEPTLVLPTPVIEEPPEPTFFEEPPEPTFFEEPPEPTFFEEPPEPTFFEEPPEPTFFEEPPEPTIFEEPPEPTSSEDSPTDLQSRWDEYLANHPVPVVVEPPTDLQSRMDEYFANHPVSEMPPLETIQFFFTGSSTSNPDLMAFELAGPFRTEFLQFRFRF